MAEGGKMAEILRTGQAPGVFVKGGGAASGSGYWGKSRTERAITEIPDEETMKREVPTEALAGFLEGCHKDAEGREICKSHFKKMPSKAIRRASGQPDPLPEFQTEDDK
jgi:hypothetical protein